jgi:EPS-associated MarR family transcriptional regulator
MLSDETRYRILKRLEDDPEISQRTLAREMGISLGKANYCLKALIEKGWIKAANFRNSGDKAAYLYQLTPSGLEAKARLTVEFLEIKRREYEAIKREISDLEAEARVGCGEPANRIE